MSLNRVLNHLVWTYSINLRLTAHSSSLITFNYLRLGVLPLVGVTGNYRWIDFIVFSSHQNLNLTHLLTSLMSRSLSLMTLMLCCQNIFFPQVFAIMRQKKTLLTDSKNYIIIFPIKYFHCSQEHGVRVP